MKLYIVISLKEGLHHAQFMLILHSWPWRKPYFRFVQPRKIIFGSYFQNYSGIEEASVALLFNPKYINVDTKRNFWKILWTKTKVGVQKYRLSFVYRAISINRSLRWSKRDRDRISEQYDRDKVILLRLIINFSRD